MLLQVKEKYKVLFTLKRERDIRIEKIEFKIIIKIKLSFEVEVQNVNK